MKQIQEYVINSNNQAKRKQGLILLALILGTLLILTSCTGSSTEVSDSTTASKTDNEKVFTLAELAEFDGQDGRSAYIAVDGVVYDVTDIPQWAGGSHAGGEILAGKDYSEEIRSISPHGTSMLSRAKKVGVLAEG
ncbi:MAG: hypothetical protein GX028_00155 [Clostridiaceae bacterium]|nr:hypothetical protein [Clostridiaceae bacterium]